MKTIRFLFLILLTLISMVCRAQLKSNIYRIEIEFIDGGIVKGYLIALNDSSIRMTTPDKHKLDTVCRVPVIKNVSLRRKNSPGRGLLAGYIAGTGIGAIIGYATYSPPDCDGYLFCLDFGPGLNAIAGASVGGLTGGLVGLVMGSGYKKSLINGDMGLYGQFRNNIMNGPRSTMAKTGK